MGLKEVFDEIYSRLDSDATIKTVFKGVRESISPALMPCVMMTSVLDEPPAGGDGSVKNDAAMRSYDMLIGLYFQMDKIDDVEEDRLNWALQIKKDIIADPENLGCLVAKIRFVQVFYLPARQQTTRGASWYESGVELLVAFDVMEDYT